MPTGGLDGEPLSRWAALRAAHPELPSEARAKWLKRIRAFLPATPKKPGEKVKVKVAKLKAKY